MKKVVLFFGIAAAVALASCGNKQAAPETPAVEVEEVIVIEDSIAVDAQEEVSVVVEEAVAE